VKRRFSINKALPPSFLGEFQGEKNHSYKRKRIILNQVKKIIPNQGPFLSKRKDTQIKNFEDPR